LLAATEFCVLLLALGAGFHFARFAFGATLFVALELGFIAAGEAIGLRLRRRHGRLH